MQSKNNGCLYVAILGVIAVIILGFATSRHPASNVPPAVATDAAAKVLTAQQAIAAQVTLKAKSWNNGHVHLWTNLNESNASHVDMPENTSCQRLDDHIYKAGSGSATLRYYKLSCNGVVGYVETDQVR